MGQKVLSLSAPDTNQKLHTLACITRLPSPCSLYTGHAYIFPLTDLRQTVARACGYEHKPFTMDLILTTHRERNTCCLYKEIHHPLTHPSSTNQSSISHNNHRCRRLWDNPQGVTKSDWVIDCIHEEWYHIPWSLLHIPLDETFQSLLILHRIVHKCIAPPLSVFFTWSCFSHISCQLYPISSIFTASLG